MMQSVSDLLSDGSKRQKYQGYDGTRGRRRCTEICGSSTVQGLGERRDGNWEGDPAVPDVAGVPVGLTKFCQGFMQSHRCCVVGTGLPEGLDLGLPSCTTSPPAWGVKRPLSKFSASFAAE